MIVTQPSFFSSLYGGMESNTVEKISWLYVIPIPLSPRCDICSLSRAPGTHRGGFISQGTRGDPGKGCSPRAAAVLTGAPPQILPRPGQILQGADLLPKSLREGKNSTTKSSPTQRSSAWSHRTPHTSRKGGKCSSSFPQPDRRHGLMKTNQVLLRL